MNRPRAVVIVLLAVFCAFGVVPNVFAAEEKGWRALSNGKDLTGWQNAAGKPAEKGWVVEDGAIVRKGGGGDLWTKDRFADFVLDLEFKTEGNSGVFIRTDNPRDCVQTGIEMQVLPAVKRPGKHSCGAAYDLMAPSKDTVKNGQWNRAVITAVDNKLTIELNGEKIIDMDLNRWTEPNRNPDGSRNKFRRPLKDFKREGHVGLQDHGGNVAYRKIRIKPLGKR